LKNADRLKTVINLCPPEGARLAFDFAQFGQSEDKFPLKIFDQNGLAYCLMEMKTITPFALNFLSPMELEKYDTFGSKRKISYVAARIALKRLARKLSDAAMQADATSIETVEAEQAHPVLSFLGFENNFHCSVSHDERFVIAVAGKSKIGVDVERASEKLIRTMRRYMSPKEMELAASSPLGRLNAAVRVWTLKEAASKAIDLSLAKAFSSVEITDIGETESIARISGSLYQAYHETIDDHIFTIIEICTIGNALP